MLRRKETFLDRVYRWRGVLVILSIPALLLILTIYRMPSGLASNDVLPAGEDKYSIVFDAGSTGSRIHVFRFAYSGGQYTLISDTFEQLKPGLGHADWAADPKKAAASLNPLLETAIKAVPEALQNETPVELRATAGLRLLPGEQANEILTEVTANLEASPFKLVKLGVTIMDGVDEGAYAWMTLNYLLGKIGKPPGQLVGSIDLGGGSVQQAFAIRSDQTVGAPSGYIRSMSGGGMEYSVYVYSYLGYGLMQGRGEVLGVDGSDSCVNTGTDMTYTSPYGGQEYPLKASPAGGDFGTCANTVGKALNVGAECGTELGQCSFHGVWGGFSNAEREFYVSSYFWDRAVDSGIITDKDATSEVVEVDAFKQAAEKICQLAASEITSKVPVDADTAPYMCLDLSFQHTMLTQGMKVPGSKKITLVKQVIYQGKAFEAAWPLGAAINTLSSS